MRCGLQKFAAAKGFVDEPDGSEGASILLGDGIEMC
jgi:hypothetical protein